MTCTPKPTSRVTYHRRKAAGLCVTCEDPRGKDGTLIRCRACADYTNEQSMNGKRRRRARSQQSPAREPHTKGALRRERFAAGLCAAGGPDHPVHPGLVMCLAHAEHRRDARRVRRAKVAA